MPGRTVQKPRPIHRTLSERTKPKRLNKKSMLINLFNAAQSHGENDDPEHQVGDLKDMLRACWKWLTFGQRIAVYYKFQELIETELGSDKV